MSRILLIILMLSIALPALAEQRSTARAGDVFEQLKALQGEWKSANPEDATRVNYRLIANGSTLVETWTMSPTRQSMTVYTMDGDALLATHYCPHGNAPRLKFDSVDASGANRFVFLDGANLQNPEGKHEHAFWVKVDGSDALIRSETYIRNDAVYDPSRDEGSAVPYVRVD